MSRSVALKKRENWPKFCTSNFMPDTPAQKRLRAAKVLSKRELKLRQREAAAKIKERDLEERQCRLEEQSRAKAMPRFPGPMPSWVLDNISRAFRNAASARDESSQS
jgi:hypothetical protein